MVALWENDWIASVALKAAVANSKIVVKQSTDAGAVIKPEEVELFNETAWLY